ncbi:MAG: hypothetical protein OEV94_12130, partial [Deltaproteobacteria bacterium]|nr:hypothetical protein [Deltaproteobacteria bacterium]
LSASPTERLKKITDGFEYCPSPNGEGQTPEGRWGGVLLGITRSRKGMRLLPIGFENEGIAFDGMAG